jgi:hypothetical protein
MYGQIVEMESKAVWNSLEGNFNHTVIMPITVD